MLGNALAGRQPGGGPLAHPLGFVRAERGWTYQDLVDAVARRVGNMSARREKAWRWEHRGVVPDRETQEALADELGVPHDVVNALGWPAWLPVGDRGGIAAPWTPDGCLTALDATAGSALLDRRGFLVSGDGSATATAAQWLELDGPTRAPEPAVPAKAAGPTRPGGRAAGAAVTEGLEQRLPHLRSVEHTLGGGRVRALADAELRMVTDLLRGGGTGRPAAGAAVAEGQERRLFAIAAELARLAGWASLDTGYQSAAERYMTAALSAAHAAGDRLLGANVLRCLSVQYLDAGRLDDGLALARAARQGAAGRAPARVTALLAVREAQAHAMLGAAGECDTLLGEAEAAMTAISDGDGGTPGWAAEFDEAEFRAQTAVCHALLGRSALAQRQLTRALLLHPAERARDRAMYLIRHAEAALDSGDPERGRRLAQEAATWAAGVDSLRIHRRLGALHQRLRRQRGTGSPLDDEVEGRARPLIA